MVFALDLERSTLSTQKELVANNLLPHLVISRIWTGFVETDQIHLECARLGLKIVDSPPMGELHGPVISVHQTADGLVLPWGASVAPSCETGSRPTT